MLQKQQTKIAEEITPKITKLEEHPNYGLLKQRWDKFHELGKQNADLYDNEAMFSNGYIPLAPHKSNELQKSGNFTERGLGVGDWYGMLSYNDHDKALASTQKYLTAPVKQTDAEMKMLLRGESSGLKSYNNMIHYGELSNQANDVLENSKLQRANISNQMDTLIESNKSLREGMENDIQQWNTSPVAPPKKGFFAGIKRLFGFNQTVFLPRKP